jgi:hypothetical protein
MAKSAAGGQSGEDEKAGQFGFWRMAANSDYALAPLLVSLIPSLVIGHWSSVIGHSVRISLVSS